MDEFVQKIIRGDNEISRKRSEIVRVVNTIAGLLVRCVEPEELTKETVPLYNGSNSRDANNGYWVIWANGHRNTRCGYRKSNSELIMDDRGAISYEHVEMVHQSLGHLVAKLRGKYPKLDELLKPFLDAAST